MNLYRLLSQRAEQNKPLRVGLIGAGKFVCYALAVPILARFGITI